MQAHWRVRTRPLLAEIAWVLQYYQQVLGSTVPPWTPCYGGVGLWRDLPEHPLVGRMLAVLDIASRLPVQLWYTDDERAYDPRFQEQRLAVLQPGTLSLLDLGFTHYGYYAKLMAHQMTLATRGKTNAVCQVKQVLHQSANLHDCMVLLGQPQLPLRLVEVQYQGTWYRYLTSELDPSACRRSTWWRWIIPWSPRTCIVRLHWTPL